MKLLMREEGGGTWRWVVYWAACGMGAVIAGEAGEVGEAGAPEEREIDGVRYLVREAEAGALRVIWKDDEGRALRNFAAAAQYLEAGGLEIELLMNGGIFEPGGVPSGLLVQGGKELNGVNREEGEGNFFLQPNGIFLVGPAGAAVVATGEYPVEGMEVAYAVQSGPLLLRGGRVHPVFRKESESRLHRNGVGVTKEGKVVLVMSVMVSEKHPNLYEFAQVFVGLGCEDALFLDGDLSEMRWGERLGRPGNMLGSFVAVVREKVAEGER